MKIERTTDLPRIAHTGRALKAVAENWSHSHGVNPEGEVICVPCMAELLFDIHTMVYKDAARNPDGSVTIT